MRFVPRSEHRRPPPATPTPGEQLVRQTGIGLALFTLALIAILLTAVGLVTAAAAVGITNQSVDSNLHTAAENMLTALAPSPSPTPPPTPVATPLPTQTPDQEASSGPPEPSGPEDGSDSESDTRRSTPPAPASPTTQPVGTQTPTPTAAPTQSATPTPAVTPAVSSGPTPTPALVDRPPESSDTFFLILDETGAVLANPQGVALTGLPDRTSATIAAGGTEDWRTIDADGVPVRLLSEPMLALDGSVTGVLQTGFVLTAFQQQQALIVRTIIVASLIGLIGAGLVSWFVTRRAMSPIRGAFEAERRFIASASHELKTPVSVVRASAEILNREQLVRPDGRYLVDDIVSESDRLGRLVGDLLALASAEAGQISITPSTFDVGPLVNELVERMAAVASARGVRIESVSGANGQTAAPALLVFADRERMLQLLTIFVDNAIDHSPAGGVVRVVARVVDEGSRSGSRVVIDVIDQGPGVPLEARERIFEPFARVSGRRRTTGTTGLGLAIARVLAARQGATLAVRDAPGGGAVFSVSLSLVRRDAAESR